MSTKLLTSLKSCLFNLKPPPVNRKFQSTFKAAVLKEISKPFVIEERESKPLSKNQVRIKVHYCSVNSIDVKHFHDTRLKLPFVPGYEISGEVIEIGKGVTYDKITIGEKCVALSLEHFHGFAEECVVNIDDVFRLGGDVDLRDGAVLLIGHSTALYTFSKLCNPKNKTVAITAGPAGLGLAAVDVAANIYKAKVIGIIDDEERGELLRTRGAFNTVSYSEKMEKEIFKLTEKKGADIVYDAVGDHMMCGASHCVAPQGYIVHAAPIYHPSIPLPPSNVYTIAVSLKDLKYQNFEMYRTIISDMLELANQGIIGGYVSANFNLENANEAIKFIEDKKCTGKVLINIT